MKTLASAIALFLAGLSVFVLTMTKQIDASEISLNPKGQRTYQGHPFSGEMVTYHKNGELASLDQFVFGRRHGLGKKWFEDGTLAYESTYRNGRREGVTRSWWFNGNRRSFTYYQQGKAEGVAWLWYRNGNKFKRFNFALGNPVGIQQAWRENGKLLSNFEYKNGRIYGLRKANNCVGLEDEKISVDYYRKQAGGA
jgi:antitoxin component YwqK of YwqJK toxin-antitoxin module